MSELEDSFSAEDATKASLVTLMQIKDYLSVIAYAQAPAQAEAVERMHSEGKTVTDFPFYDPFGVAEDDEDA